MWAGSADLFTSHGTLINPSGSSGLDEGEDAALSPETPPEARGASEPAFKALFTLPPAFILQHVRNRNEALLLLQISCAGRKMDQLVRLFITELQQGDELEGRLLDAREWRDPIKLAAIPILSQSHAINHRSTTCVVDQLKRCIREVTTLRNSLAHYAQINSTLAEELRAEGCEGLAGDKATLAEVERALLKRVNNLLSAQHPYQGSGTPWESILASILNSPSASSASSDPTSSPSTSSSSSSSSSVVPPDRKGGRQDHRDETDNEGAGEKSDKERKRGTEAGPTMSSFSSLFTSHTSEIQFAVQTNPSKEAKANHKSGRGKNEERKGERHERGKPTATTSSSAAATSALTTDAPVASPYSAPANARLDRQHGSRALAPRSASHSTTDTLDIPPQPPRPASPSSSSPSSSSSSSSSSSTPASSASTFAASRDKTAKGRESHSDESSSFILCSASVSYSPPLIASPASPPRHHHRRSPSPPSASAAAAQQHSVLPSFLCSSSTPPPISQPQPLELAPSPLASLATTLASLANAVSPIRPVDSPSRGDGGSSGGGTPLRDIHTPFSQPEEPLPPPAHPHAAKKNDERKKNEARKGTAKVGKSQADEESVREEPTRKRVYEEARIPNTKTKTKTKKARRRDTPHTRITASKNQQLSDGSERGDEKSVEAAEANEDLDIEVDEELEIMLKRDDEEAEEAEKRRDNEGDWPWPSTLLDHSQLTPFTYSSQAADINPPSSSASPPPQPPQQPSQQRREPQSEVDQDDDVEDDGEEEGEGGRLGPTPSFQSLFAGLSPSPELGSSEDGVEDDGDDDDDDIDI